MIYIFLAGVVAGGSAGLSLGWLIAGTRTRREIRRDIEEELKA